MYLAKNYIVSGFTQEKGYTEILRAKPKGFPEGSGYNSPYTPTRLTKQTFSITIPVSSFLGEYRASKS